MLFDLVGPRVEPLILHPFDTSNMLLGPTGMIAGSMHVGYASGRAGFYWYLPGRHGLQKSYHNVIA